MAKKSYSELLKDPRWQRKRLEVLQAADFRCDHCDSGEDTLHVHHRLYRKGAKPWEYENGELQCLCENCHATDHELRSRLHEALAKLDRHSLEQVLGYAETIAFMAGDTLGPDGAGALKLDTPPRIEGIAQAADVDTIDLFDFAAKPPFKIDSKTLFAMRKKQAS